MVTKKDNVVFAVEHSGRLKEIDTGLEGKFKGEVARRTGMQMEDLEFTDRRYSATLYAITGGEIFTGESPNDIRDAIEKAKPQGTKFDKGRAEVRAEAKAQVPYFTIAVTVRSIYREGLEEHHANAVEEISASWGQRLRGQPESVSYMVIKSSKQYGSDTMLPKEAVMEGVVGEVGKSSVDLDQAARNVALTAGQQKQVNSTVYQRTTELAIYGPQPESLETAPRRRVGTQQPAILVASSVGSVGAALVSPARAGYHHAVTPAGKEPLYLETETSLM